MNLFQKNVVSVETYFNVKTTDVPVIIYKVIL